LTGNIVPLSKTETAPKDTVEKHPTKADVVDQENAESTRDRLLQDVLGERQPLVDNSSGDLKNARTTEGKPVIDGLPQVEVSDDTANSTDEITESGAGGSKLSDNFEYKTQPSETIVSSDQSLAALANSLAPGFYGDAYPEYARDPFVLKQFEKAFTQALAFANGISPDASVSQGDKLIVPGRNSEGEPLFAKDGIKRQWGSNTVDTLEKDNTRRTQFDDGTLFVYKPDGTSTKTDVLGVVETSKTLPDGTFQRERSDGTYEKRFTDGSSEQGGLNGVKTRVAPDGTITTSYRNGEISTLKPDGTQIFVDKDKSVMTTVRDGTSRTVDEKGHLVGLGVFGNEIGIKFKAGDDPKRDSVVTGRVRPEWNFTLSTGKDGAVEMTEGEPPRKLRAVSDGEFRSLSESRTELFQKAESNYDDPIASVKFKADLIRFENRAKERGLSADEVLSVYKDLDRLLTPTSDAKIDDKGRAQIAAELAGDLASPYTISQGAHGTCNVKILQVMMSAKHPERVSSLITEAAMTGQHTLPSGRVITLPEGTLTPHNDAIGYPSRNGARGFAGQVFDSAAVNTLLQVENMPYRFDQLEPDPSIKGYKSGDIMVDIETGKPLTDPITGSVKEFNGLYAPEIVEVYKQLMGASKSNEDWLLDPNYPTSDTTDGIKTFASPEELSGILKELKQQGQFPYPIHVDTRMAPFWADSSGGLAGGSGGAHVLNIADYNPVTNSVLIDNQWASYNDRLDPSKAIPVDKLFSASVNSSRLFSLINDESKAQAGDDFALRDRLILTKLNDALKDADPNLLRLQYDAYSRSFGLELEGTKQGDPANVEMMNLYRNLNPFGKLAVLQSVTRSVTTDGGEPQSFSPGQYENEVVSIASEFGMSFAHVIRGLQTRPQTVDEAIFAHVIDGAAPGKEAYNNGRLDVIRLLAGMPEATRTKMLDAIQVNSDRRLREAREFAAKYAE